MNDPVSKSEAGVLPAIPAKRYFTIGEVSQLCGVKPHVLRYWEQEFTQLKPVKRRGNRRYYQHHEVLLIRCIRELLYEQGFTISGARNRLDSGAGANGAFGADADAVAGQMAVDGAGATKAPTQLPAQSLAQFANVALIRTELIAVLALLKRGAGH
ncbi:MAG: MerR family transcriptional regulator [Massilia sp.]|nr:MerR family transcriptional regulator [Massilia sp.]